MEQTIPIPRLLPQQQKISMNIEPCHWFKNASYEGPAEQNQAFLFYTAGVESRAGALCTEGHRQDNG
jgi:hypothetical protein